MKYFIDTEFIEGIRRPIQWLPALGDFNKSYHSIQLISIGIVAEDGREFYAVSNEFNPGDANDWVKENVISKLPKRFEVYDCGAIEAPLVKYDTWKPNKQIAEEAKKFCLEHVEINQHSDIDRWGKDCPAEFYAYYADYDWVVFCALFGTMMDLPKGFPMYCRDMKQDVDREAALNMTPYSNFETELSRIKAHENYPKQTDEHNALADARWNFELYKFLCAL